MQRKNSSGHTSFGQLKKQVVNCTKCSRLVKHRRQKAEEKVKRFRNHNYWGRPVPGFGDAEARLWIIGLAPAAHGANRTGRMFTGDSSGDWLYKALYETGFASQSDSTHRGDGLTLNDCFITSIVKCVPPDNKPNAAEIKKCNPYLQNEESLLSRHRIILALGRLAFRTFIKYQLRETIADYTFGHHVKYTIGNKKLVASYHPSRQNTQTGRLKWDDWLGVFQDVKRMIR